MCRLCDYDSLLRRSGLEPLANRLRVLEVIGEQEGPLGARDIRERVAAKVRVDRVTIYRILDRLVEKGLVERLGGMGRRSLFALAPNEHHPAHPHFLCLRCGGLFCLKPLASVPEMGLQGNGAVGEVSRVEIRLSGLCRRCLGHQEGLRRKGDPEAGEGADERQNGC